MQAKKPPEVERLARRANTSFSIYGVLALTFFVVVIAVIAVAFIKAM